MSKPEPSFSRPSPPFDLRVPKTAEVVAEQIRRRIIRGELKEGDFLPHESALTEAFAISRPTLREAFRILEAEQLISVLRGSRTGARVHRPRIEEVSRYAGLVMQAQSMPIADVFEARLAMEPFVVRRLAEMRPLGAADRLLREADRLDELANTDRHADFLSGLVAFHQLLMEVSGNRTLVFLTRMLAGVVASHQDRLLEAGAIDFELERKTSLKGIRSYRKLARLIDEGDADGAVAHWELHLKNANKAWLHHNRTALIEVLG